MSRGISEYPPQPAERRKTKDYWDVLIYITATNLAHYLIGRSLITADSVVDSDFQVVEAGRRNRNFKVARKKSPGLFLKQISSVDPESIATLGREAAFYEVIRSRPGLEALSRLIPRLIDFNPEVCALAVDLIPEGENLTEYHLRLGTYPEAVGAAIGEALGIYHSQLLGWVPREGVELALFPRQVPWMLALDPATLRPLSQFGAAGQQLATVLYQHSAVLQNLLLLRYYWRRDSLIHGDIKFDNCLVFEDPKGTIELRVVDWELVDLGDASWDVASIISSYLTHWFLIHDARPGQAPVEGLQQARSNLEAMQPSLRAFWQAYVATRHLGAEMARLYLDRCIRFCAAKLVLSAFECMHGAPQWAPAALLLLRVGQNLLESPDTAVSQLFGP